MSTTPTDLTAISELAWALAAASATGQLDTPGEYIWAFPRDRGFYEVRARSQSIFSSGNSIKDPEVLTWLDQVEIAKHLRDPWIVGKFEQDFGDWLLQSENYRLGNFEQFRYRAFSAGTQEAFLNFYLAHHRSRFRVFRGDYWWHMDIWSKMQLRWAYIEDDDLAPGDVVICSMPFALTGDRHPEFDWMIDQCCHKGIPVLVDFIYLANSKHAVDIDLSAPCIQEITYSFSKTFPVQCAKIAIRMRREKPQDPMQMSNDENICNRLSAGLAWELMHRFPPDYMVSKYSELQQHWCRRLGLQITPVVHFALGEDYTAAGRTNQSAWCSPFNQQQNRYNLGMLYENPRLLESLGYPTPAPVLAGQRCVF